MAFNNFPSNPTQGDLYDTGTGVIYRYESATGWEVDSTDATVVMAEATETSQGIVELATSAEVIAGTDTTKSVTPAGLKAVTDDLTPLVRTATPTLSYAATGFSSSVIPITISNYDASYTYVVSSNDVGATITRTDDVISYTSSYVLVDTAVDVAVTAEDTVNDIAVSSPAVASITVLFTTLVDDTTDAVGADDGVLLYQGADMVDTYYDYSEKLGVKSQKLKTSKVAYNAIAYTGNGTSQDIVNDIEMNLDGRLVDKVGGLVWLKSRGATGNNAMYNTLTGANKHIITNSTAAIIEDANWYANFLGNGFTVTGVGSNAATTHSSWNQRTTQYTNGYTNHGKYYEVEINPLTGFFQGVYEGSGTSGHEIPHGMGVAPDFIVTKNLDAAGNQWVAYSSNEGGTKYLYLNTTAAYGVSALPWGDTNANPDVFTTGSMSDTNSSAQKHYFYGFANTAGKVKVGTYTGTGVAGNAITGLGFEPVYVMVKCTSAAGSNWVLTNSKTGPANQTFANLTNAESGATDRALSYESDGFTVVSSSSVDVNQSSATYLYIAIADHDDFETTLYTGNGGTQGIVTGLNMDVEWLSDETGVAGDLVSSTNPLGHGLVAKYELDSTSDDTTGSFDGVSSNITYSTGSNGRFSESAIFNGTSSTVDLLSVMGLDKSNFTISTWVNTSVSGGLNKAIICLFKELYFPVTISGATNTVQVSDGTTSTTSGVIVTDGTWHNIVAGKFNGITKIYIDSVLVGSDSVQRAAGNPSGTGTSFIGAYNSAGVSEYFMNGSIDQVEIYNRPLTEPEIRSLYLQNSSEFTRDYAKIPGGLSWIKSRSAATNHAMFDTLRGPLNSLRPNATTASADRAGSLTSFNSAGFSLGTDDEGGNANAATYINWSWGTTHQYSGVTNHGKPYTCAFNPISGFTIVKYTGSGTTGHEIPHHLDRALDFVTSKRLNATGAWYSRQFSAGSSEGTYLTLDTTTAESSWASIYSVGNTVLTLNDALANTNGSGDEYIMYGWANSMTQEVIEYTGTGVAGNFVKTAKKPGYVMIKRLDAAEAWFIIDNKRGNTIGLQANLSDAEFADAGGLVSFGSDEGFVLQDARNGINASGGRYLAFVMYDTDEDTNGSEFY